MRPNLINRLKEEWNNLDPVDPLRGLIADAIDALTQTASKPWVGLTDEDIEAAMPGGIYDCLADPWDCGVGDGDYMRSIKNDVVRIVRAIEAKLKEKNHG